MASEEKRPVSFKIIPEEDEATPRLYANFCSIQNSPFDFTLTFCDVHPLGERELQQAQETGFVGLRSRQPFLQLASGAKCIW